MAMLERITPFDLERTTPRLNAQTRAELHLRIQYAAAQILAEAKSETEAWGRLLEAICSSLGWQWGGFWRCDGSKLRLIECWIQDPRRTDGFADVARSLEFGAGEGLPGRVWQERRPIWLRDFSQEPAMPRRAAAALSGLHTAFGFPISGREFLGVIEFFHDETLAPDPDLIQMMAAIGAHLGQFLERKEAEAALEKWNKMLARAGVILGEGLNFRAIIQRVARLAIPDFADWCLVDILRDDGRIERWEAAHAHPQIEAQAREVLRKMTVNPLRAYGSPNVIRTGEPELITITDDLLRAVAGDEQRAAFVSALKLRTSLIVPLKAQGRTFGSLSFLRSEPRAPFAPADIEIAQELARRAGWALDNARLYESARQELKLREQAEEELKNLNHRLEARIEERTAALQDSHAQMEAFCYSVSHDLRAPLRSMQGFSQALLEDHAAALNPEGRDFARRILAAAAHMDHLIADVLAYSRLSRQELKPEPVELAAIVAAAHAQLQAQIRARRAQVEIAPITCRVFANRSVLELMLVNLLENALKFVPAERTPAVSISVQEFDLRCRIWVRDNGIGIARENHQRIFRIFERLHGVEIYPGTGIGLALVQKAVERMNGSVGLESTLGAGSAFWIELPKEPMEPVVKFS